MYTAGRLHLLLRGCWVGMGGHGQGPYVGVVDLNLAVSGVIDHHSRCTKKF